MLVMTEKPVWVRSTGQGREREREMERVEARRCEGRKKKKTY